MFSKGFSVLHSRCRFAILVIQSEKEDTNDGRSGLLNVCGVKVRDPFYSCRIFKTVNMAYMNQERKAQLSPAIRAHCRKYGVKASIGVRHCSTTLVVNITSGKLDFCTNAFETCADSYSRKFPHCKPQTLDDYKAIQVNPYWAHEHFSGKCRDFIVGLLELMNIGNHDNSDAQVDYFEVGWYVDVNIGSWNKPYVLVK